MTRLCYVNGQYIPSTEAMVPMFDRGYHFADGIYEVIIFFNRNLLDEALHLERLHHSLDALRIPAPMSDASLKLVMREMIARHPFNDGYIYLQVTRGVARRDHPFPKTPTHPSLSMFVAASKQPKPEEVTNGVRVVSAPDQRWERCDIKSISLLPNTLARQYSIEQGAREVFLVNDDGMVTEGSLSNAYIVKDGTLITHQADHAILGGVRRNVTLRIARECQIPVEERAFSLEEAKAADEAFLTSANSNVLPVTTIDDATIGSGKPGDITLRLLELYKQHVTEQTGRVWA